MTSFAARAPWRVSVARDYDDMSRLAANYIEADARTKPDLLLCLSAGGSPTGAYQRLAHRHARVPKLFSRMRAMQIDEWGGLERGNPATCRVDLQKKLLSALQINGKRFAGFVSDASNPKSDCARMARWLARNGPIDICVLGLGLNGHIAMNEPGDHFMPHAHVAKLARRSLGHGMLKDLKQKPRYGMTLGMADILCSRRILLVVSGRAKRAVLKRLFEPCVSARFPASFLWLHPDVTVICDRDAAHDVLKSS